MHSQGSTSGREWDEGPSNSSAADDGASQSVSAGGAIYERSDSVGAKKQKTRVQYFKISSDDLWAPQRQLGREEKEPGEDVQDEQGDER